MAEKAKHMTIITTRDDYSHSKRSGFLILLRKNFMLGILNKNQIEELLHGQLVGRLGCCAANKVYIMPISYAYDEGYIYAISREGLKVDVMRKNSSVCFQVDRLVNMSNWQSVIGWGEFEELTESQERNHALEILSKRILPASPSEMTMLSPSWPFQLDGFENIPGVVYRIFLKEKTGRFEQSSGVFYAS